MLSRSDEVEIVRESFQAVIIILLSQQLLCQAITQLLTGLSQDMELLKKSERQAEDIMCLRNLKIENILIICIIKY